MTRFELSDPQAQAILDMQLRRLAALERQKIEDEHQSLLKLIDHLEDLLANPKKILAIIKTDLEEVSEKYGDERRTRISPEVSGDLSDEDLVVDESVLISITERGYIKRVSAKTYRAELGSSAQSPSSQSIQELKVHPSHDRIRLALKDRSHAKT